MWEDPVYIGGALSRCGGKPAQCGQAHAREARVDALGVEVRKVPASIEVWAYPWFVRNETSSPLGVKYRMQRPEAEPNGTRAFPIQCPWDESNVRTRFRKPLQALIGVPKTTKSVPRVQAAGV
jgi:hypothetical protein